MQTLKTRLAVYSSDARFLMQQSLGFEPLYLQPGGPLEKNEIEILIVDARDLTASENMQNVLISRENRKIRSVLLASPESASPINASLFNRLMPNAVLPAHEITEEHIFQLSNEVQQEDQNNSYLDLASELNSEYEKIKTELENKIHDKTKVLIESRRKVFELNTRIEFLRKALFTISGLKTIDSAEEKLNELLTSYNLVTWFKIVKQPDIAMFESQVQVHFESTFHKIPIEFHDEQFALYFFKGDKRPYKKSETDLFKKIAETLQSNLYRIGHLARLKMHENFFDLAFQSSHNAIIVIDQNFRVHQANQAALRRSSNHKQTHCYEMLFGRTSRCVGCELGKSFQIQEENSFFSVHSKSLSLMEQEDQQYWVHVYEDATEKNMYEKKLTQFARLEELGLISSSIAHELNNPLGGILSFLQIMKMELPAQHKLLHDLNLMQDTALRMKKTIEDLLIFSRSHSELVFEDVDVFAAAQTILTQFDLQFKVERIKVAVQSPPEQFIYKLSKTLFQDSVNLIFQFFLQRAHAKKPLRQNFTSLVEVKLTQDQMNTYLIFAANLGPLENEYKTKDLNLLAIEKALTDQGFQLFISEPARDWIQLSVPFPK